jgi:hypothetical protein
VVAPPAAPVVSYGCTGSAYYGNGCCGGGGHFLGGHKNGCNGGGFLGHKSNGCSGGGFLGKHRGGCNGGCYGW